MEFDKCKQLKTDQNGDTQKAVLLYSLIRVYIAIFSLRLKIHIFIIQRLLDWKMLLVQPVWQFNSIGNQMMPETAMGKWQKLPQNI